MIKEIIMPKLGETMEEGTLLKWFKKEGDKIEKGESLFEVTSDKTSFEVEAETEGVLRKILIQPGETPIPVTKVIGYLADNMEENLPEIKGVGVGFIRPETTGVINVATTIENSDAINLPKIEEEKERVSISPLAKRLAKEKDIDIAKIKGSGPAGRIEKSDILKITGESKAGEFESKPLAGIRKAIAQRMTKSKTTIPHYYLQAEIGMEAIAKSREEKKFSYTDFILKATATALSEFPLMNASIVGEDTRIYKKVNIGLAIATEIGLLVPVIKEVNKKSLGEISQERIALREKAVQNKLSPHDLAEGTFTISNLGTFGVDNFTAIINPPQVGILALGMIKESPVAVEGKVTVKKIMKVTLSADHRLIDGVYGAQFLQRIKELLETPEEITTDEHG